MFAKDVLDALMQNRIADAKEAFTRGMHEKTMVAIDKQRPAVAQKFLTTPSQK